MHLQATSAGESSDEEVDPALAKAAEGDDGDEEEDAGEAEMVPGPAVEDTHVSHTQPEVMA